MLAVAVNKAEALKRAFPERPVTFEFWWLHA